MRDRGDDSSCDDPLSCCCAPISEAKLAVEDEAEGVCRALPVRVFKLVPEEPQANADPVPTGGLVRLERRDSVEPVVRFVLRLARPRREPG